jgi:glyoxylase-like metal-dependent hydrolase (beta-lactamase superfamily II)
MASSGGPRAAAGARGRRRFVLSAAARGGLALLALAGAGGAPAQDVPPAQLDADLVRTGLYLIRGGGGNSLLRLSANGMVLIDGKRPGNYRALMSQVRRISRLSDLPVRVLVLTDHHEDRAGTCAQFLAARIPIAAQRNALSRLSLPESRDAAAGPAVIAYDRDHTLRLGGVEVQLKHFGNACTDGDTIVYFPDLKIVALGDLFVPGEPEPDLAAGGSLAGWSDVLSRVLELDFDRVVPGTGPVVDRGALVAFKGRVDAAGARAGAPVQGAIVGTR